MKAEWCGKPLAETRCTLAPGHDGLCCTSMEASLVAKCESLRSSLRAAEAERGRLVTSEHDAKQEALRAMRDRDAAIEESRRQNARARAAEERAEAAERWREEVADGCGYLNRPEGQGGYEVAEPRVIIDAFRAAERRAEGLEEALGRFVTFHSGNVLPPELGHAMEDARALARPRSEDVCPAGEAEE